MNKAIPFCLTFIVSSSAHANWVDKWFDNATATGPSSFESQKRGFYSLGGFQGRVNTSVDNPISIQLPRLSGGCGGVNLFYGGVSLMDEEFLVQKLESIMQAAPAIAFDMAIKTLTKEYSDSLGKYEQITNALNSLQLDDCAIAKAGVTAIVDKRFSDVGSDIFSTITSEVSLDLASSKNSIDSKEQINTNDGKPTEDLTSKIEGCYGDFKDMFAQSGSVIEKATARFGMSEYANMVRGYIGDIEIHISAQGKIPVAKEILPCDKNADGNISDFVYGYSEARTATGVCANALTKGAITIVEEHLNRIATAIQTKAVIPNETQAFIDKAPLPVWRIMYRASVEGTVPSTIQETSEILSYAYAERMFDELYRNSRMLFYKINKTFKESGQDTNYGKQCDKDMFTNIAPLLPELEERLYLVRGQMREGYNAKLKEYDNMMNFIKRNEELEKRIKKESQGSLGL